MRTAVHRPSFVPFGMARLHRVRSLAGLGEGDYAEEQAIYSAATGNPSTNQIGPATVATTVANSQTAAQQIAIANAQAAAAAQQAALVAAQQAAAASAAATAAVQTHQATIQNPATPTPTNAAALAAANAAVTQAQQQAAAAITAANAAVAAAQQQAATATTAAQASAAQAALSAAQQQAALAAANASTSGLDTGAFVGDGSASDGSLIYGSGASTVQAAITGTSPLLLYGAVGLMFYLMLRK